MSVDYVEQFVERFPWFIRAIFAGVGAALIGLLVLAVFLTPSPNGYGTHEQLGFPPCTYMLMSGGTPCPSCGMTTSWSYFVRGNLLRSVEANVGGMMLAAVAFVMGPWLLVSGLRGYWWMRRPNEFVLIGLLVFIVVVTLVTWAIRVF